MFQIVSKRHLIKADKKIPLLITGSLYLAGHALKFNETIID